MCELRGVGGRGEGPPGSGPSPATGRCLQSEKEGRHKRWKPHLPGRGLFPGPSAHPWGPHGGPCGFRKDEARAAIGTQLCTPPAPSRLLDGVHALGPRKEPGRPLPARLGREAPLSFLSRHGGPPQMWLFPGFHGTARTGQGCCGSFSQHPTCEVLLF